MSKKLFHHIVTEPEVRGAYNKIVAESRKVFSQGGLFEGFDRVYTPKDANGDPLAPESKKIVTTATQRLEWTEDSVVKLLDFEATRDTTNMKASADLELDGIKIAKNLPAPFLLSLEKKLQEVREYYDAVPTLDTAKRWEKVEGTTDQFRHGPIKQYRTAKQTKGVVLYPHTEKHPAQVKEVTEDVTIGTFETTTYSGAIHPGDKAALLGRIDKMIVAVKEARMKANEQDLESVKVGKSIFDYIHSRK